MLVAALNCYWTTPQHLQPLKPNQHSRRAPSPPPAWQSWWWTRYPGSTPPAASRGCPRSRPRRRSSGAAAACQRGCRWRPVDGAETARGDGVLGWGGCAWCVHADRGRQLCTQKHNLKSTTRALRTAGASSSKGKEGSARSMLTVRSPSSVPARKIRIAISPRFATMIFWKGTSPVCATCVCVCARMRTCAGAGLFRGAGAGKLRSSGCRRRVCFGVFSACCFGSLRTPTPVVRVVRTSRPSKCDSWCELRAATLCRVTSVGMQCLGGDLVLGTTTLLRRARWIRGARSAVEEKELLARSPSLLCPCSRGTCCIFSAVAGWVDFELVYMLCDPDGIKPNICAQSKSLLRLYTTPPASLPPPTAALGDAPPPTYPSNPDRLRKYGNDYSSFGKVVKRDSDGWRGKDRRWLMQRCQHRSLPRAWAPLSPNPPKGMH